jgi:hypothetical protein
MIIRKRAWTKGLSRVFLFFAALTLAACSELNLPGLGGSENRGLRIDPSEPVPVALLLPRGSQSAQDQMVAQSLENAARLAIADLQGVEIDLRVYATGGGDPNVAARAAAEAVNEGAKVIIGPLYGQAAIAAGSTVAEANVNVLTFSNNPDVAGGNVFLLGRTFENVADRLVSYAAANNRGRIFVVHETNIAGTKGAEAISAAIDRNGAVLAGTEGFERSQAGVNQVVPRVVTNARAAGAESVFFTSETTGALPILTQLLRERGISSASTQFIGLTRWDIPPQALQERTLQNGWFALPDPGLSTQFRSRYQAAYGNAPHPLAGLAYDGVAAIGALVASSGATALNRDRITQSTGFAGVNGIFRLRADGTNERGLAVATIRENKIVVLDPAPRRFGGAGS